MIETGFKTIRHVNRRTGGGLGAAFFALLLAIGLYLLPIGQDLIWAKLYQLADENVWKAWLYLYLLSLGFITLGYWGLSAKRTKITYRAGAILIALAIPLATASIAIAQTQTTPTLVFPNIQETDASLIIKKGETVIPFIVSGDQTYTIAILGHTSDGWKPLDAFDNNKFFLAVPTLYDYDKLQIQIREGSDVLNCYTFALYFTDFTSVSASINSASGPGLTASMENFDGAWVDGQVLGPSPSANAVLSGYGLHVAAAYAQGKSPGVYEIDSDMEYTPSPGQTEIAFTDPQDGANVDMDFTAIAHLTMSTQFPVQEIRFGADTYQVDNPLGVVSATGSGDYSFNYSLAEGTHHLHVYAVDYDLVQPIGAEDYHPPPGYNFRIIRAEDHITVICNPTAPPDDLQVVIDSPADGDSVQGGTTVTVQWHAAAGTPDHYEISIVSHGSAPNWEDVGTSTSYSWDVPSTTFDADVSVRAWQGDNYSVDTITVHVVSQPTVTIDSPVADQTYENTIPISITIAPNDAADYADVWANSQYHVRLTFAGGQVLGTLDVPAGTYTVEIKLFKNDIMNYNITIQNVNVVSQSDTAPRIIINSPSEGSVVNTTFTIEWDITAGTVNQQNVVLNYSTGETVISVSPDARSASVTSPIHAGWLHVYIVATNNYGSGSADVWVYVYDGTPSPRILSPEEGQHLPTNYVIVTFDWGIPPDLRDHLEYRFDWYSSKVVVNSTGLTSIGDQAPSGGSHWFSLTVYDTSNRSASATVTFYTEGEGSGWIPGGGETSSSIPTSWLIIGGIVVLALLVGGRRR